jgi:tetratricopeptide (TPR) repeat protein
MTSQSVSGYTTREVARMLDLPVWRVRSFVRSGFVSPRRGARREHRFTFQDLVLLRTGGELVAAGVPTSRIGVALDRLRDQLPRGRSLTAARISAQGGQVVVRESGDLWEPASGQGVIDFEVAELAEQAALLEHREADGGAGAVALGTLSALEAEDWFDTGCRLESEDPQGAERAYRQALDLAPDHADARLNLGRLLHEDQRLDAAERAYRRSLDSRPDDPLALFNLGVVLQDLGRRTEAIDAYRRAVTADPHLADAYFNLAGLYEEMGEQAVAIQSLKRYRELVEGR